MEQMLTVQDVADFLQISAQAVRDLLRRGELKGVKVRGKWRVTRAALNHYINREGSK